MDRVAAIVLAAGAGTRMGTRKQFLELSPGQRIVDRAIATCRDACEWVGVVVPSDHRWDGAAVDAVIPGADDRFGSIVAGAAAVPPWAGIVVVHSASHPLAPAELLRRVVAEVRAGADGVVPILAVADTVKRRNDDGSLTTVGREGLGTAQAPMAYRRPVLDRALADAAATGGVVEESMAVEHIGGRVVAVDGEPVNLHVTDRRSLAIARRLATPD